MADDQRLIDTAFLLPTEAAALLAHQTSEVQGMVVSQVANMLDDWKARELVMDPITYDAVLQTFVGTLVANARLIAYLKEQCAGHEA